MIRGSLKPAIASMAVEALVKKGLRDDKAVVGAILDELHTITALEIRDCLDEVWDKANAAMDGKGSKEERHRAFVLSMMEDVRAV